MAQLSWVGPAQLGRPSSAGCGLFFIFLYDKWALFDILNRWIETMNRDDMRFMVFLASTALHSALATCDRLRTACGIVKNKRLRGVGYNGSVSGLTHCDDEGHLMIDGHCLNTRHGEKNAISNTNRDDLKDGQAIIIATPCIDCIKDLSEEGVKRIDYIGSYENAKGTDFIGGLTSKKEIELRQHNIDWAELFQNLFDLLARKGGILYRSGYRLKVVKESLKEEQ
jgi:dCMP deaminase